MAKNVLKVVLLSLLFISIVLVPLVGVEFYESDSIFDEGALYGGHDFSDGSNVTLSYTANEGTSKTLSDVASILKNRFEAFGYNGTDVKESDGKIVVSLPMENAVESIVGEVATNGKWNLTDLSNNQFLDDSFVEKAELTAMNGYYFIKASIVEDKQDQVKSSVKYVASSGAAYAYLSIDGQNVAFIQMSESFYSKGSLLIGPMSGEAISSVLAIMNSGSTDGEFEIESVTNDYPAKFSPTTQKTIFIALLLVLLVLSFGLLFVNKEAGIGAALAVISNAAVLLTSLANKGFQFSLKNLLIMSLAVLMTLGINLFAIQSFKNKRFLKVNLATTWIHVALFIVTVAIWMLAKGTLLTIGNIFMTATVSSFVTYFVFTCGGYLTYKSIFNQNN